MDWIELSELMRYQKEEETGALQWWRDTCDAHKTEVWMAMTHLNPPRKASKKYKIIAELVSRFAQMGMTNIAILAEKQKESN